ncbi:3-hydroxyacyl-CoA dehydrogenase family protein [bacterium]|nr:3-hydroxyacyl-CoA dehydrogenase family protein [bacterium]
MSADPIRTVAVLGAGIMGHGIAQVTVMSGYTVHLYDIKQAYLDRGINAMDESLGRLLAKGKISNDQYLQIKSDLLKPFLNLEAAVQGADLVIEAIPEVMELKRNMFTEVDNICPPHTILATNTSTIRPSQIATATQRPDRFLGMHYFTPVVFMPLIEIIRADQTSEETMGIALDFALKTERVPLRIEKDTPGFIANRVLQFPKSVLLGCILDQDIVKPEALDDQWRTLTGSALGPFEIMDFAGLDTYINASNYLSRELHPDYTPCRVIQEKVNAGQLGRKSGRGIYDYSDGKPKIGLSETETAITAHDVMAVMINEATKIIEEGLCTAEDVDKTAIYGMRDKEGPMTYAKRLKPAELAQRLDELADMCDKEIFRPTEYIRMGAYL